MTLSHTGLRLVNSGIQLDIDLFEFPDKSKRNAARANGQDPVHVKQLVQSFESNGWNTDLGYCIAIQSPITKKPILIDGHHRRDAWKSLGHTSLPCDYYQLTGVCSLSDILMEVSLKANDHPPARANGKRDVERYVTEYYEESGEKPTTVDEIVLFIKKLGLTGFSPNQVKTIAGNVFRDTVSSAQIVQARKIDVRRSVEENVENYGRVDQFLSSTVDSAANDDYVLRNLRDSVNYVNATKKPSRGVVYVTKAFKPSEIYQCRTQMIEQMKELYDAVLECSKHLDDGEYPFDIVGSYPQIPALEEEDKPVV